MTLGNKIVIGIIFILLCGAIGAAGYYYSVAQRIHNEEAKVDKQKPAKSAPTTEPALAAIYTINKASVQCESGETRVCTGSVDIKTQEGENKTLIISSGTVYSVRGATSDTAGLPSQSGKQAIIASEGNKAIKIDIR